MGWLSKTTAAKAASSSQSPPVGGRIRKDCLLYQNSKSPFSKGDLGGLSTTSAAWPPLQVKSPPSLVGVAIKGWLYNEKKVNPTTDWPHKPLLINCVASRAQRANLFALCRGAAAETTIYRRKGGVWGGCQKHLRLKPPLQGLLHQSIAPIRHLP